MTRSVAFSVIVRRIAAVIVAVSLVPAASVLALVQDDQSAPPRQEPLTVIDKIQRNAEMVQKVFRENLDTELTFDQTGIEKLAGFIDRQRENLQVDLDRAVSTFGSFFGEALRRDLKGEWVQEPDQGIAIKFPGDITAFPFNTIRDHIQNGEEDSIANIGPLLESIIAKQIAEAADKPAESSAWIQLFNGQDLTGWTPKIVGHELGDNYANTFRVEDGLLTVSYADYVDSDFAGGFKKFGHLFYKGTYSRYRLRAEYRFVGEQCPNGPGWAFRNNGLMLHGQDPATMERDQDFPVSIEVQLLGGDGKNPRPTLNLCTPGTNVVLNGKLFLPHCTNSSSATYHGDQWVTAEVEVLGGERIQHIIDGQVVLEYSEPQYDERDGNAKKLIRDGNLLITEGTIAIQSESHPTQFRKIELLPLPPK